MTTHWNSLLSSVYCDLDLIKINDNTQPRGETASGSDFSLFISSYISGSYVLISVWHWWFPLVHYCHCHRYSAVPDFIPETQDPCSGSEDISTGDIKEQIFPADIDLHLIQSGMNQAFSCWSSFKSCLLY